MKLLIFSLLIFLASCKQRDCSSSSDHSDVIIHLNLESANVHELKIAEFVDSVQFIHLETTEHCIVGEISKVLFIDSVILAVDRKAGVLSFFNNQGKYLYTLDKRGKGPGEYTKIDCVLYDSTRQQIALYDGNMRKMILYRRDGSLIREIRDFSDRAVIRDLINLPDGSYLCYAHDIVVGQKGYKDNHVGLWKVDSVGRFIQNFLQYHTVYPILFSRYSAYLTHLTDWRIGITDGITGDIYYFENDSLHKFIAYNIEGPKITDFAGKPFIPGSEFSFINFMFAEQKGDYVYSFWSDENRQIHPVLYSKQDQSLMIAKIPDRAYTIGHHIPNNCTKIITSVVTGTDILQQLSIESYPKEVKQIIREQVTDMTEDQIAEMNPLLEIWHVKN